MAVNSLPKNVQRVVTYDAPTILTGQRFALASNEIKKIGARLYPRHRKALIITNESNSNKMAVVAASSEQGGTQELKLLTIFVNSSVILETNDDVYIKATDGAISEVQVLEVVYNG
jgi:hypothetical protein